MQGFTAIGGGEGRRSISDKDQPVRPKLSDPGTEKCPEALPSPGSPVPHQLYTVYGYKSKRDQECTTQTKLKQEQEVTASVIDQADDAGQKGPISECPMSLVALLRWSHVRRNSICLTVLCGRFRCAQPCPTGCAPTRATRTKFRPARRPGRSGSCRLVWLGGGLRRRG